MKPHVPNHAIYNGTYSVCKGLIFPDGCSLLMTNINRAKLAHMRVFPLCCLLLTQKPQRLPFTIRFLNKWVTSALVQKSLTTKIFNWPTDESCSAHPAISSKQSAAKWINHHQLKFPYTLWYSISSVPGGRKSKTWIEKVSGNMKSHCSLTASPKEHKKKNN